MVAISEEGRMSSVIAALETWRGEDQQRIWTLRHREHGQWWVKLTELVEPTISDPSGFSRDPKAQYERSAYGCDDKNLDAALGMALDNWRAQTEKG
jgi:hypothetical protein